jgi:sugar phosphate isomerase/epimerase
MKRRNFLTKSTLGAASLGIISQFPARMFANTGTKLVKIPIGFQSYVLREEIGKDITATLKEMKALGYEYVEMCSPSGYMGPFEPLAKYSGMELKGLIEDTGMGCISSHFTLKEMRNNLDERIDFANQLGLKHFVLSSGLDAPSLDEIKSKCGELNAMGEKISAAGMTAAFHNHDAEFKHSLDGRYVYDILLEELDPGVVKMQYQTQVIKMGIKGSDYFKKFPGRFVSAHLQDYDKESGNETVLGQGISDWTDFFEAAPKGGLQIVYVEMESNPGTLAGSVDYLKGL